jgi:hypothetical protein
VCRRRLSSSSGTRAAVAALICTIAVTARAVALPVPPCSDSGASGWCVALRITGDVPSGELGFRFGEPRDVDGDGRADIAAGSRFKREGIHQAGRAGVWSGASGALIRAWDGEAQDALFGHWVLPIADLGDDGLADLIVAAPIATSAGAMRGLVVARSPKSGEEMWRRAGDAGATFGWDLAVADDSDADGRMDVFVGAPANPSGRVYLLSGKDGTVLRTYTPRASTTAFGWIVVRTDDFDADGRADLAVGAPPGVGANDPPSGGAYVLSSRTGEELHHWKGSDDRERSFGEMIAAVGDLDGDGRGEVVVASPATNDPQREHPGDVRVFSGTSGKQLRAWSGRQAGELYGRMVVSAGDVDRDGVDDLAIGAPWHRTAAGDRVGRVELRSGRSGGVLDELFGDAAGSWFGWHIRRAPDPDGGGQPALLIGSLRKPVGGHDGTGAIDLYVLRRDAREGVARGADDDTVEPTDGQGTVKRGARRNDIK